MSAAGLPLDQALPLFPLRSVLYPQGRLGLQVFEARYLDLISQCLREQCAFGVVCLRQGGEVRQGGGEAEPVQFEALGTLAHLVSVDADQPGLLQVLCEGGARFRYARARAQADGLWLAEEVRLLDDDPPRPPGAALTPATEALARALALLDLQAPGHAPQVRRLDDAGWVAHRWAELLPAPLAQRQQWLAQDDPLQRLAEVQAFLQAHDLI
jgi:uncharacterized protein